MPSATPEVDDLREKSRLPVVHELQGDLEVLALEQSDHFLQVVALLARNPEFFALDLCLDALGTLVADGLGDLLGLLGVDTLDQGAGDLVRLARPDDLAGVERLQGDVAADELFLEHLESGLCAFLGIGGDHDVLFTGPFDLGVGATEVVALRQLFGRLIEGVVDLLPIELADHVER